jgi:hypothetical protein
LAEDTLRVAASKSLGVQKWLAVSVITGTIMTATVPLTPTIGMTVMVMVVVMVIVVVMLGVMMGSMMRIMLTVGRVNVAVVTKRVSMAVARSRTVWVEVG